MPAHLTSRIPQITRAARTNGRAAVERTVFDIEAEAKQRSRVDTGQMRNGWTGEMAGEHEGHVSNAVRHTIYNEYGTRYMSAQPMLSPAVEHARTGFERAVSKLYE